MSSNIEQYLQSKGLSKATIKAYSDSILNFITWLDKEQVAPEIVNSRDLMGYLLYLKRQNKSTLYSSKYLIAIGHFFDWQLHQRQRKDNPVKLIKLRGLKSRKLYNILSKEELESIYHKYDATQTPTGKAHTHRIQQLSRQRNKSMLGLIVYQGLLTSEVNDLQVSDIRLKEGTVYIAGSRTSNERTLELKPHQIMELMEYLIHTRKELLSYGDSGRQQLFLPCPSNGKATVTNNNSINIWKRLTQDIKKQQPRFLNFLQVRTCVITHWLKLYNLREVQYRAGHRYVSTTEGYLINHMEDLQQDIDNFHPIG